MVFLRILSLMFFSVFSISIFLGLHVLFINPKNSLNRLFFGICHSLSIWAFAFSMVNSSKNYEFVFFWRRISSIGWGTIFAFLLHFTLILTGHREILKKRWIYYLLYLPSVVFVYIFGLDTFSTKRQYVLVFSDAGWINTAKSNFWDWMYNIYYMSFAVATIVLLIIWMKKSRNPETKKEALILITSFFVAIMFGTITEMVINIYTDLKSPQMSPIISIIPILAIYYSVRHYGLMRPDIIHQSEPGEILNTSNREKIYKAVSKVFLVGGLLNFAAQYYFSVSKIAYIMIYSVFLLVLGILFHILPTFKIDEKNRDRLFTFFISISIPAVVLPFLRLGGMTIWALPFIMIIMSVVFKKREMLIGITISTMCTEIFLWINNPQVSVNLNGADYIVRIALIIIAIIMANFINKIYIDRIVENKYQIDFQKMISDISADFISINDENTAEKMENFLRRGCEYFDADRAFFISNAEDIGSYEYADASKGKILDKIPEVMTGNFDWWNQQMDANMILCYPDIELLPVEAYEEKMMLEIYNVKGIMSMPVIQSGKRLGFLLYVCTRPVKACRDNYDELMRIMVNILSESILRCKSEKEISRIAYYDELTGLPNKANFKKKVEEEIAEARKSGNFAAVVYLDIDSFRNINDTLGHPGGDEMLRKISRRLSECLQKKNMVARFGSDEFLILIRTVKNADEVDKTVEKIRNSLRMPIFIREQEFYITSSGGIAMYPEDGENAEMLIKNADIARNSAKNKGRNNYALCTQAMKEEVVRKTKLINQLYWAGKKNEFLLFYQPQINIETGKITGVEALLRWDNPEFGLIMPSEFIPLAEETGLINGIGQWVLETACTQNKRWQELGLPNVRVAVNISVEQFMDKKLPQVIDDALKVSNLSPEYLQLEIGGLGFSGEEYIIEIIQQISDMGVSFSMDNFRKSGSLMAYLKKLPINQLKIDIEFVKEIAGCKKGRAIVKTIIQMGKNLEFNVVAEGVENEEEYEFLKMEKCNEVQGYYFYEPLTVQEFEAVLSMQR